MNPNGLPNGSLYNGIPPQMQKASLKQQIFQSFRDHPLPPGWQQTYRQERRLAFVLQITTQIFCLKPEMGNAKALEVALTFEGQKFVVSPDENTYANQCHKKLNDITKARHLQAANTQQQLQGHPTQPTGGQQQGFQPGMVNPNQFQQALNGPQPQQMTQAQAMARMQMQRQMEQQAQQHQQQQMLQQPMSQARMPQNPNIVQTNGNPPQMAQPIQQLPSMQGFTPQDQKKINEEAQRIAVNLSEKDRHEIARKMQNVSMQVRESLEARGMNPIQAYLQEQTAKRFRARQLADQQQSSQAFGQVNGGPPQGQTQRPGMPGQAIMPQNPGLVQGTGNMTEQFIARQQEAVRLQQAGQQVVPGSIGPAGPSGGQQAPQQPQQSHEQHHQANMQNPAWQQGVFQQSNQSLWNNAPGRPMSQNQNQNPNPNHVGTPKPAHQQALQGQLGGLTGNMNMRSGQHTPAMPNLNKPHDPQAQLQAGRSPIPGQLNPPQAPNNVPHPVNGQPRPGNGQVNGGQVTPGPGQAQAMTFAAMPPQMRQHLNSLPSEEQKQAFFMRYKHDQQRRQAALAVNGGDPRAMQPGMQQPQPPQGFPPSMNPNPQSLINGGQPTNAPPVMNQTNQVLSVPGQPQAQPGMQPAMRLGEAEVRMMDRVPYPPSLLKTTPFLRELPEAAKTWGALKLWISQNAHRLPNQLLPKMDQFQAMHYQQSRRAAASAAAAAQSNSAGPTAQPVPVGQPRSQNMSTFQNQVPTMQEVHNIRANVPDVQTWSDDQIRQQIMAKRMELARNQNGLNNQQQRHANMMRASQMQQNKVQTPNGIAPPPQPQHQNRQPAPKAPQANMVSNAGAAEQMKQTGSNRGTSQANQKNLKRNKANDDVVEISDPKLSKPTTASVGVQPGQANKGGPQPGQRDFQGLSDQQREQRSQLIAQQNQTRQKQAGPSNQAQASQPQPAMNMAFPQHEVQRSKERVMEVMGEIRATTPRRPYQPMSPQIKGQMARKILDSKTWAVKVDIVLTLAYTAFRNEGRLREMAGLVLLFREQIRDQTYAPADNFTITYEELDQILSRLQDYCRYVQAYLLAQKRVTQEQNNAPNQQPQESQPNGNTAAVTALQQTHAPTLQQPQKLTAERLKQQEDDYNRSRAATVQKNRNNAVPPAPTSTHHPFQLGHPSPNGAPLYHQFSNELTQDKLVLPNKRRKPNNQGSAATTPVPSGQTPGAQSSPRQKSASPKMHRTPAPSRLRCTVAECKAKITFTNQAELDRHLADAHPPEEEEITDPLSYCLEGFRMVLNLDENGKARPPAPSVGTNSTQALAMKPSNSFQGPHALNKEITSAPMSRAGTATGPSPAQPRTPQPAPATAKNPSVPIKPTTAPANPALTSPDPWTQAKVPQSWFPTIFSDVAALNRPGGLSADYLSSWLDRNPFNLKSDNDSSSSDASKQSPHASDISANDNLDINLTAGTNGGWVLPSDWLDDGLSGDLAATVLDPALDMDWETAFGDGSLSGAGGAGKVREGDDVVSDEFLKIYKPQELVERRMREEERQRRRMGGAR